jgi:hypothetical protein
MIYAIQARVPSGVADLIQESQNSYHGSGIRNKVSGSLTITVPTFFLSRIRNTNYD